LSIALQYDLNLLYSTLVSNNAIHILVLTTFGKGDNSNLPDFMALASDQSLGLQTHRSLSELLELLEDDPGELNNLNITISESEDIA
jgi:hypothetical protein